MAVLGNLIALRRLLIRRGAAGKAAEKRNETVFFAWFAGILVIRLLVNAFFVRTALMKGLCSSPELLAGSLSAHNQAVLFLFTLFILFSNGVSDPGEGRVLLVPISPERRAAADILAFLSGPFFIIGLVFLIPPVITFSCLPGASLSLSIAVIIHVSLTLLALGCRSAVSFFLRGSSGGRGFTMLFLLIAVVYTNPEYHISRGDAAWRTMFGSIDLRSLDRFMPLKLISRAAVSRETGMLPSALLILALTLAVAFFFISLSGRRYGGKRKKTFPGFLGFSLHVSTPAGRDIAAVTSTPDGFLGGAIAIAGGVYLFLRPEGGLLPLMLVTFGALIPVFRVQVRLFGKDQQAVPRYIWSSYRLEKLFISRAKTVGICSFFLILPILPAAVLSGSFGIWITAMVVALAGSTVTGLIVAMIWYEKSSLSMISLLIPGLFCVLALWILRLPEPMTRLISLFLLFVSSVAAFFLLLRRSRRLSEGEKDEVLLSAM